MKSIEQKRQEAFNRLVSSTYANSKAKRKGTMSESDWQKSKDSLIEQYKRDHNITSS